MSALDEMRKRVNQNKVKIDDAETKTSNALDEMRKRVEAKKQEIEAQNKKVQEYNDFLKTTDISKIKPLQLPQDKLLSRERVAELARNQTEVQREIDYYTKNPATFGSNLKRNLLEPTKQALKNISTAALSTGANTIEYYQDNNAVTVWNDEKKATIKALNEQFSLPKGERTLNLKQTDTYNKILEDEAQKRYEDTDALTQRLRDMRTKIIQETQNMEDGLGKSIAESSIVVGDMLPAIGAGVLTGGIGSSLAIYGNAAQNAYQTAIDNGATHEQASNNATLNGLLEATIELIGGKALGKLTKLPTLSSKVGGKILSKMPNGIKAALNNTFIRGGLEVASDVLEEGFEEVVSGFIQPFIDRVTYNPEAPLVSFKSQWEAFSSSILPTLMFAGINAGSNRVIASLDKQMAIKSVNTQINNLANKQIQQIENTELPMLERVEMINEVKKQQIEAKNNFTNEINKFEVVETNPETNLKTTLQNYTNFAKTSPINENISQNNAQNVSNLQKIVQNNSNIQGLEDYTEQDIKDLVSDYIQDLDTNVQIKGIAINGSRARGDSQNTSDLDVVVEYIGDISEDALFNVLNEEPLIIDGIQVDINPITEGKSGTLEQYIKKSQEYDAQKYEESDVFEDRASYNVDITKENEYNIEKREVSRKPETRNYTYKKIESRDIARVNSDYMTNEIKYADDVGVVNFDDVSYAYEKTNDGINVLLKFKGNQNYIKGVTEYVRGSSNTRPKGYNRYVEIARSRYADNNISDADGGRTRTSEESNIKTDRTRQQGQDNDITENVENNGNNLKNSEEQGSFSMDEDTLREPRAEYENQMKLNMDVTTEVVESAKNYNGGMKPIVIGHRIWEGYKKQGYIDLNNTKVSTAQDMAEIAQIFRNPYYETFRVIYTKGKGRDRVIVGQEALTSFLPSSVNLINKENTLAKYTYKMKNRMKRLEADGYYLLHNHPSGNAKASKADIKLTETIANLVPGFNNHIIVDHGTYAYIYITQAGMTSGGEGVAVDDIPISTDNSSYKSGVYTEEKLNEYLDKTISNRTEIVKLASNFRHDKNYSTLILGDSRLKLSAVIDVPNSIFSNNKQIENYIRNISKKYGATNAFITTQDEGTYQKVRKNVQNVRDIILYRANGESFVKATQGDEVFFREAAQREKRSWGISEETKEERIERVRKYVEETQKSIGTLGANVSRKDIVSRIIDNYGITAKGNSKELDRVSKEIQELIKKGGFTDNKIEGYAEQLIENLKVTTDDYYNANKELKELIRRTKLYASDSVKAGFADWADFRKSNVGTIRATNDVDALPVDTFYQELSEMYGETFFPSDIINPSDQLQKIAEVAKQIKVIDMTLKQNLEENFGEQARNEIVNGLIENFKTLREQMTEEVSQNDVVETPEIKTRRWSQTVRKNDMVHTFLDKDLQDYKYVVRSNKATIAKANETLMRKGYNESIRYFDSVVESGKFPTVDDIALGERLIQESIKRGEFEKATEIIADVSILGTELGQAVQAMSMISRLSPAGQLMYLQRAVKRINDKQQAKTKKTTKGENNTKGKDVKMDNSKLLEMFTEIVTGAQSKIDLPKEIRDNSKLMNLVDQIIEGKQTKLELAKAIESDSKLSEIISEIVEGEQEKLNLGALDESLEALDEFKKGEIEITPEMEREILSAKTPEELEIAVTRVKEQIAAQLPVEASEKLSEWRYLAMLGNPKTHIRNTVGNLMMAAPYETKNLYQRIIETTFDSKLDERTKTFKKATDVVKAFAEDMVEQNKDTLTGNGYTNIQSELKNMRKMYKNKVLETLKEANLKALDFEDFVFKKRTFKNTLAEYLTANGIRTEKDIQENQELIQKGINYAIEEAKKATFNQYNAVATAISRFESDKAIGKILIGGLAPFKRTPLNIVKTAWQYSPAGLAETLTFRTIDLKNGLISSNDYIERISQGLTGVSITAIGFLLASMGVLTGSMGNKKKDKYEQSIGLRVPYSIKAGDRFIDISWLSPSAIPLLIGAELYSLADDGESGLTIDGIVKVVEKMMNPISEMTMLSTFNDALINYAGENNELSGLAGIIDTVVKSYIGQAFPTLGGQINRIIDPTIRTTKVSKNSKFKTGEQIVRQNMNKIVGLSYLLEPSTDVWGNIQKRSDNVVLRSLDALANPASIVKDKSTSVDKEIMKLYDENENDKIIPKTPNNYFTLNGYKYEFSAKEYTAFKITYGQTAYTELQKLFRTTEYKGMTTEDKEKAIQNVYDLAEQAAREEYGITPDALTKEYGEKEAANRLLKGEQVQKYEMANKNLGLNLKQYYEAYNAQKDVEGKKDAKGDTISGTKKTNRINAMEKTGLTKSQATQLYKILEGEL